MLIVFSGLPGTGKSVVARELARRVGATYLRIDTIETAIASRIESLTDTGYRAAYGVAEDNLKIGRTVIADSVNPIELTRNAWRSVAGRAGRPVFEVEVTCSDTAEHQRRVETRTTDIVGLRLPTWPEVRGREYAPWNRDHIVIDTAAKNPAECVVFLLAALPPIPS